jgi:hypothetical protein
VGLARWALARLRVLGRHRPADAARGRRDARARRPSGPGERGRVHG